ncbi:MAG: branched-chain amino acid ABC transporter permease [Mycobacterium sp.]|nr:branched-chain amino acid ABC transporter permease [Mycobacterium sp.]
MARTLSSRQQGARRFAWPIGFVVVIAALFVFYHNIFNNLQDNIQADVNAWLPITTVTEALVWVIMALGLNVVVGYAGLLDLGYVAFWAFGGYTAGWLMAAPWKYYAVTFNLFAPTTVSGQPGIHITFWFVLVVAGCICAIAGILIGAPTLRLRGDYLAIVTLGFGEMASQLASNGTVFGFNLTNGDTGIPVIDPIGTGPFGNIVGVPKALVDFADPYVLLVLAALAGLCLFVSLRIRGGRLGRAWLAIREDELAASMMGVGLVKAKLTAYAVGAFFGGIGGVAFASAVTGNVASSKFQFSISITVLLMVVLGGMGNVWGVTVGAVILTWINATGLEQIGNQWDEWTGFNVADDFVQHQYLLYGIVLIVMMLFRPGGLIPEKRTSRLMREPSRTEAASLGAEISETEVEDDVVAVSGAGGS